MNILKEPGNRFLRFFKLEKPTEFLWAFFIISTEKAIMLPILLLLDQQLLEEV